jgi:chaperonin GroEL (HSP60 family)
MRVKRCSSPFLIGTDQSLGFILDKTIGVNCPKRLENAKILIANTAMDTDKIKIFGSRVKVDGTGKLAELERAEKVAIFLCIVKFALTVTTGEDEDQMRCHCGARN